MNEFASALTRASGLAAAVVAVAALVTGALFSARETGERRRPAWWLDLHNGLGGLAMATIGVHVGASLLGSPAAVRLVEAVVPGAATTNRWALGWGVIGMYLFAATVFTTWPRRLSNRRLWRLIHVGSAAGVVLSLVHGYQMGSDAATVAFHATVVLLIAPVTYSLVLRAVDAMTRARPSRL